ncbi:MAG: response regulator [archaeon]
MKTIMVVDDEKDIRNTIKTALENNGYNVITAINGEDCLRQLPKYKGKIDLILMDIMMPGMPVKDVVPQIKDIKLSYLSVVNISSDQKKELTKQKNVVDFIQKPFDVPAFIKQIRKIVGK